MVDKLSIKEAAEFLGVNAETLRRWDRSGKLKAQKINKRGDRRYNRKTLEEFKKQVKLPTTEKEKARDIVNKRVYELDTYVTDIKYIFSLSDYLREARDLAYFVLENEKLSNKYQRLIDLFNFVIDEGTPKAKMSGTDSKGKPWSYPTLDLFTEEDIEEIEKLLSKYKHPWIRSHIAQFLWIIKKDYRMGQTAIEELLKLSNWFIHRDLKNPSSHFGLDVLNCLENALVISKKLSFKDNEVLASIGNVILTFNENSTSKYKLKIELIELAKKHYKSFDNDFWIKVLSLCKNYAQELDRDNNSYFSREYLQLGYKIEKTVLSKDKNAWREAIAANYLREADRNKNSFVQVDLLNKAYKAYEELKDTKKLEEIENMLKTAKKNMKFQTFEHTIDLQDWAKDTRERFAEIIKVETPEQILMRLASDKSIIPRYDDVKKLSDEMTKRYPLQHIFSQYIVDGQDNIIRKYETDLERDYLSLLKHWGLSFETYKLLLLILFDELVKAKKLSWETTKSFMETYFWYGKEYEIEVSETDTIKKRKWIELLEPGIKNYIDELYRIEESTKNKKPYQIEIVTSLDSLVLKIEGLVREFYDFTGFSTNRIKRRAGDTLTSEKKVLDELLRDTQAEEIFGKDLTLLMKYVLIEPVGYNLRNNIAHTFLLRQNYLLIYAHLIFLIILRIGNFKLSPKEPSGKESTSV